MKTLRELGILEELIEKNPFSRPARPIDEVKGIVLHWVANPGTSAMANRNYFDSLKKQTDDGNARYASAHYVVGIAGEIVQCLPRREMAYHAGAPSYKREALEKLGRYPNGTTIGIELCHPDSTGRFTLKTWQSAAELTAVLLYQYALNANDIWTHHQITGKNCPKWFVDYPNELEIFKTAVSELLAEGGQPWN